MQPASPAPTPTRAIALLALAGFSGQAMVRAADSLLPQIADDIGVTVGAVSIIVTAYAITHGSVQLIIGPIGDRFGEYQMTPQARGTTAVAIFSSALYLGQSLGVSVGSLLIDRAGGPAIFIVAALGLPMLGLWFAMLRGRT